MMINWTENNRCVFNHKTFTYSICNRSHLGIYTLSIVYCFSNLDLNAVIIEAPIVSIVFAHFTVQFKMRCNVHDSVR